MLKLVSSYCFYVFGITFYAGLLGGRAMAQEKMAGPQKLIIDGKLTAQRFDGIGAVFSYEKLFYDYTEQQRNEILDYLFLPNYGAALQILKVEIGYDGNNTASSWPAHRRSLNEKPDFNRGFV